VTRPRRRWFAALAALLLPLGALWLFVPSAGPAQADLQNPRQEFLRGSTAGLFLHWGERTAPSHTSCSAWEADVTNGGWNAKYWADEAVKLHTQYLVLATFHSRLGYARPYPSAIPGSCRTTRDFLGELIAAAADQHLRVIMYMTDDPKWHAETGHEWLDSAGYSAYKGHSVNLTTRDGFGQYSYDLFFEIMQRYPNLGGFWIDNDNAYWESHNLYQQIHQIRPNFTLSNNNEDTPEMDMISNEQKTGMTPSYDYPQKVYTAAPRLIEADFKLPTGGSWWFSGSDSAVDRKLTLGRLITNAGSSIKALMAETAQVNGKFPGNQVNFNNFAAGYLSPIWESLGGTEGGGYMYGGLKPGRWNNGAYGVTTISRTNGNLHYIHVIDPPTSGSSLVVRDNGYLVSRVTNLRTGAQIAFSQGGGNLTLTGLSGWDPYDTVFKVETNGRVGIYPASSITVTASAAASGHDAPAAADGNYLTYWDNGGSLPASLYYNLGGTKQVQYIGVNQREDSVVSGGTSARIRDYRIYVSDDGTNWGSPVRTGTLPNARGVVMLDIPKTQTSHVRLEIASLQGGSRIRIDDSWIASDYANGGGGPTEPPVTGRFEAEQASLSGATVATNHPGFSGSGFIDYAAGAGGFAEWTVTGATAGAATLTVQYANGGTSNRTLAISVNGAAPVTVAFPGTGSWDTWNSATLTVPLNAGTNTVRATATTTDGGPNIDYLGVTQ
jgi:alpha-L-fucosidase